MSINENLSSNLILTIRLEQEVAMNKKGLRQGKQIYYSLFKEVFFGEKKKIEKEGLKRI